MKHDITRILKRVTLIVKIAPFIFALGYIVTLLVYLFGDEYISAIVDMICYVSPIMVALLLLLSLSLKLCVWHRVQCLLPLITKLSDVIDSFLWEYTEFGGYTNAVLLILIFILSIINAYFVFTKRLCYTSER